MSSKNQIPTLVVEPSQTAQAPDERDEFSALRSNAAQIATQLPWLPRVPSSNIFELRIHQVRGKIMPIMAGVQAVVGPGPLPDDTRWLRDNSSLIFAELATVQGDIKLLRELPHVRTATGETLPRVLAFAQAYFRETAYHYQDQSFAAFCRGYQQTSPLELREFTIIGAALKLVLLEEIAARGRKVVDEKAGQLYEIGVCIQSLREVSQTTWSETVEPLILFGDVLRQDPVGAYAVMDAD